MRLWAGDAMLLLCKLVYASCKTRMLAGICCVRMRWKKSPLVSLWNRSWTWHDVWADASHVRDALVTKLELCMRSISHDSSCSSSPQCQMSAICRLNVQGQIANWRNSTLMTEIIADVKQEGLRWNGGHDIQPFAIVWALCRNVSWSPDCSKPKHEFCCSENPTVDCEHLPAADFVSIIMLRLIRNFSGQYGTNKQTDGLPVPCMHCQLKCLRNAQRPQQCL